MDGNAEDSGTRDWFYMAYFKSFYSASKGKWLLCEFCQAFGVAFKPARKKSQRKVKDRGIKNDR